MTSSVDPDQLASKEANCTVCNDRAYPGSAGQGLKSQADDKADDSC